MHGRWLAAVRPRLGGLRLELLTALAPADGPYLPQFLLPAVSKPWPELAEELDAMALLHLVSSQHGEWRRGLGRQIAKASSSNATASRKVTGSSTANS
jgi:hypothetical protein